MLWSFRQPSLQAVADTFIVSRQALLAGSPRTLFRVEVRGGAQHHSGDEGAAWRLPGGPAALALTFAAAIATARAGASREQPTSSWKSGSYDELDLHRLGAERFCCLEMH